MKKWVKTGKNRVLSNILKTFPYTLNYDQVGGSKLNK